MSKKIANFWHLIRLSVAVFGLLAIFLFSGMQIQQWIDSSERSSILARFPVVRAEERAMCAANNKQRDELMAKIDASVQETHELAAYTLRFLGDRAKVTDERNAKLLKQTQAATVAAATAAAAAQQTAKQTDKKLTAVIQSTDIAASAATATQKRLDTAVHPAQPAQPWAGTRGK